MVDWPSLLEISNESAEPEQEQDNIRCYILPRLRFMIGYGMWDICPKTMITAGKRWNWWENLLPGWPEISSKRIHEKDANLTDSVWGDISPDFEIRLVKLLKNADEMTVVEVRNFINIERLFYKQERCIIYLLKIYEWKGRRLSKLLFHVIGGNAYM